MVRIIVTFFHVALQVCFVTGWSRRHPRKIDIKALHWEKREEVNRQMGID